MKVVLFCGGFGMRLREYSESTPKPMVNIGNRPILLHLMKYYAHYGHKDFILCLGWKAHAIKQYFLNYNECLSNDFTLSAGGKTVSLFNRDIHDWNITFVDTGTSANIGQRLKAVEHHLVGEDTFLANYADGLSDLHLPDVIAHWQQQQTLATFLSVRPTQSFHTVEAGLDGRVRRLSPITRSDVWMNGGFFVMSTKIFDYLQPGDDLVDEPFDRLIAKRQLSTYKYEGFWGCMDTFKEKQVLDDMVARGNALWAVWEQRGKPAPRILEAEADTEPWSEGDVTSALRLAS